MNTFIIISAVIVGLTILAMLPSLSRRQHIATEDTREDNIRIARERLEEIEKSHANGELSDEEFSQAKKDLEIALAQDLSKAAATIDNSTPKLAKGTLLGLVLIIPAIVIGVYQHVGAPQYLNVVGPSAPASSTANLPPIGDLVKELESRLNEKPDNAQGWFLLGRTFMKMGDHQGAVRAYRKLLALMPSNTTAKISLVDALSMVNDGNVPDEAVSLLDEILKEEPEAITALWLAGNAAHQREQFAKAQAFWERAYPLLSGEPSMQQELSAMLSQVSQQTGNAWQAPAPATTAAITVNVALAPELLEKISDDDIVFIYAKAQQGPPMPVAVARHNVSELPIQVILTDSMAMMPQMTLSTTKDVLVGARISKTGQAIAQSGDLQAKEVPMNIASTKPVSLLINQIKP